MNIHHPVSDLAASMAKMNIRNPVADLAESLAKMNIRNPVADLAESLAKMHIRNPGSDLAESLAKMNIHNPAADLAASMAKMNIRNPAQDFADSMAKMKIADPASKLLGSIRHLEQANTSFLSFAQNLARMQFTDGPFKRMLSAVTELPAYRSPFVDLASSQLTASKYGELLKDIASSMAATPRCTDLLSDIATSLIAADLDSNSGPDADSLGPNTAHGPGDVAAQLDDIHKRIDALLHEVRSQPGIIKQFLISFLASLALLLLERTGESMHWSLLASPPAANAPAPAPQDAIRQQRLRAQATSHDWPLPRSLRLLTAKTAPVRASFKPRAPRIDQLPAGTILHVIHKNKGWVLVMWLDDHQEERYGWVRSTRLSRF